MTLVPDPVFGEGLAALAHLRDHLVHAEQSLHGTPLGEGDSADPEAPSLPAVFAVAHAAIDHFVAFFSWRRDATGGEPQIALHRTGHKVLVIVDRSAVHAGESCPIAGFIAELRRADERLLRSAELLGLLLGLGTRWAVVGFAATAVLLSLRHSAPRILALGQALVAAERQSA